MAGRESHKKGEEKGAWYEIKCTKDVVRRKEARGEDASFEKKLLRAWAKCPGWEDAKL